MEGKNSQQSSDEGKLEMKWVSGRELNQRREDEIPLMMQGIVRGNECNSEVERMDRIEGLLPGFYVKWQEKMKSPEQEVGPIRIDKELRTECENYLRTIFDFENLFDKGSHLYEHMENTTETLENDFELNSHGMEHVMFVMTTAVLSYLGSRALTDKQTPEQIMKNILRTAIGAGFHDIGYKYCLPEDYEVTEKDRTTKKVFDNHAQIGAQTMEKILYVLRKMYKKHPALVMKPFLKEGVFNDMEFTEDDIDRIAEAIAAHDTPDHDDAAAMTAYLRAIHASACAVLFGDKTHVSKRKPRNMSDSSREELLAETKSAIHKRLTIAITDEVLVMHPEKKMAVLELKVDLDKLKSIGYKKENLISDIQEVFSRRYSYLSSVTRSLFRTKRKNSSYVPFSIAFDFGKELYPTVVTFEEDFTTAEPENPSENYNMQKEQRALISYAVDDFGRKKRDS